MKKTAFFAFVFFVFIQNSYALPFFNIPNKAAEKLLDGMERAQAAGDCTLLRSLYSQFSSTKPSSKLREKAYYYDGRCYEKTGSADKAISVYKLASELYPSNKAFPYRLALIYNDAGFYSKALPLFKKVLQKDSRDIGAVLGAARASRGLGRLNQAIEYYEKTISVSGDYVPVIIEEYVICLNEAGRYEEARAVIKNIEEKENSHIWPALNARTYAAQARYEEAASLMSIALEKKNCREYRLERAFYQFFAGRLEEALSQAEVELAINKNDSLAALLKGIILRSNNKAEADIWFKKALCGGKFVKNMSKALASSYLLDSNITCN